MRPVTIVTKQDMSGTATSEEYDKVSHGDAHSVSSPVENYTRVDQKSYDGARGGRPKPLSLLQANPSSLVSRLSSLGMD